MKIEIQNNLLNQTPVQRRIVLAPQVPAEDRAEEMDREALASVPVDLRPVDLGNEEEEHRGPPSGFSH